MVHSFLAPSFCCWQIGRWKLWCTVLHVSLSFFMIFHYYLSWCYFVIIFLHVILLCHLVFSWNMVFFVPTSWWLNYVIRSSNIPITEFNILRTLSKCFNLLYTHLFQTLGGHMSIIYASIQGSFLTHFSNQIFKIICHCQKGGECWNILYFCFETNKLI